jgi:hypothetical protein
MLGQGPLEGVVDGVVEGVVDGVVEGVDAVVLASPGEFAAPDPVDPKTAIPTPAPRPAPAAMARAARIELRERFIRTSSAGRTWRRPPSYDIQL